MYASHGAQVIDTAQVTRQVSLFGINCVRTKQEISKCILYNTPLYKIHLCECIMYVYICSYMCVQILILPGYHSRGALTGSSQIPTTDEEYRYRPIVTADPILCSQNG